jgi:tRNA(Arg) A34 adenosine deaminase TadA
MKHEKFIRKAIDLAISSGKKGNYTFGSVLVHQNKIIATAENSEQTGEGFGHAEYNLAIQSAQRFPDSVFRESTFYTSATPCPRCTFSILALGIKHIVIGVSYNGFAQLMPGESELLSIREIADRLGLEDVEIIEPVLEAEGMRAFEYWGGEYHPLEELLESAKKERENSQF